MRVGRAAICAVLVTAVAAGSPVSAPASSGAHQTGSGRLVATGGSNDHGYKGKGLSSKGRRVHRRLNRHGTEDKPLYMPY